MTDKTELIFGYGSLMSYRGLFRNPQKIKILDAFKAQIKGDRGFAKPCHKNNIYCMDIDNFELEGDYVKNYLEQGFIEGLVTKINQEDFPQVCKREGYDISDSKDKGKNLISCFSNHNSVGEGLWELFQENIKNDIVASIRTYRIKLCDKVKGTSIHYIPHPIALKNIGYAITFIAPGKYGTGDTHESEKVKKGIFKLLNTSEVLKVLERNELGKKEFLDYFIECILGGIHGINISDLINSIPYDSEFMKNIKREITKESIVKERIEFACGIFSNLEKYLEKFGKLDQNLTRSGLKSILNDDTISELEE